MAESPSCAAPPPWPLPLRIALRFFFVLSALLCVPALITTLPGGSALEQNPLGDLWNRGVSWVGALGGETLTFSPEPFAPERALLSGTVSGAPIELRLERVREDSFLLVNRGFHWVNDEPLNR